MKNNHIYSFLLIINVLCLLVLTACSTADAPPTVDGTELDSAKLTSESPDTPIYTDTSSSDTMIEREEDVIEVVIGDKTYSKGSTSRRRGDKSHTVPQNQSPDYSKSVMPGLR